MIHVFKNLIEIICSYFSEKKVLIRTTSEIRKKVGLIISTNIIEPTIKSEDKSFNQKLIDLGYHSQHGAILRVSIFQDQLDNNQGVQAKLLVLGNRFDTLRVIRSVFPDSFLNRPFRNSEINEAIYFSEEH